MHIIDFKYGKGVRVTAKNNPQMKLYALGALNNYSMLCEQPDIIEMTIFQPRIENISTWSIETATLLDWANTELNTKQINEFDKHLVRQLIKKITIQETYCEVKFQNDDSIKINL